MEMTVEMKVKRLTILSCMSRFSQRARQFKQWEKVNAYGCVNRGGTKLHQLFFAHSVASISAAAAAAAA